MAIATPTEYGGYEYSFVNDPPDRCICKICQCPSRNAYMTGQCCQGLTICKSCLDHWQITAGNKKCPVCRKEEGGFHQNYPVAREIKTLHIYCSNKEKGCEWQGELNDISSHLGNNDGCKYKEVKCFNKCGIMIQRQYLTSHVRNECPRRKVDCQYCHETGEHYFIEGQHKEECPKLPLPCPNKCGVESVPREDMEVHRKECPLEIIPACEYYSVGCKRVRLARKDQENHSKEDMEEHLKMTYRELTITKARLAKLTESNAQLNAKLRDSKAQFTAELTDSKAQLAAALKQIASLTGILMNAQLGTAASHIRSVHLHSMATLFNCGNQICPVIFKMSEYSIKRKDTIEWCSDPFYTQNKGYKMCLKTVAAGSDGNGTHLSVYVNLMKGPHDNKLMWPLRGKFEIKLLNQINDSEHHSETLDYDENIPNGVGIIIDGEVDDGWGWPHYISNEELKTTPTCQFLKDDCLFFQITNLLDVHT